MQTFTLEDAYNTQLMGDFDKAEWMFVEIIRKEPENWMALHQLAALYQQSGREVLASILLERAITLNPTEYRLLSNLGVIYRCNDHYRLARPPLEKAAVLAGDKDADVWANLGSLYVNDNEPTKGEKLLRKGVALDSDNPLTHWNLSLTLLEQGKWEEGWKGYSYGKYRHKYQNIKWHRQGDGNYKEVVGGGERPLRWAGFPEWRPTDKCIKELRTVLIYGEQGIGDEIMFMSMIPDLLEECSDVVYECHPRLESLINRSFPEVITYPTRKESILEKPIHFDYQIAMGDLGQHFRNSASDFPGTPYLKPDPELVQHYRDLLAKTGPPPYYGLGWRGGYKKTRKGLRSLSLSELTPILEQPGTFISMQYDEQAESEIADFCKDKPFIIHHWKDVVEGIKPDEDKGIEANPGYNYDHTAALAVAISEQGQIICCNTALVHICGALGISCWTLTPNRCAWRYQRKGPMPWYNSVRQFRQQDDNDWTTTVNTVVTELQKESAACQPSLAAIS